MIWWGEGCSGFLKPFKLLTVLDLTDIKRSTAPSAFIRDKALIYLNITENRNSSSNAWKTLLSVFALDNVTQKRVSLTSCSNRWEFTFPYI